MRVSLCSGESSWYGYCTGDTYIRVKDVKTGMEIRGNNNACGLCSAISFVANQVCTPYQIVLGCVGATACGGVAVVQYFG